jgi:hypothetical protein
MTDFAKQYSLNSGANPPPDGFTAETPLEELEAALASEPSKIKRVLSFYLLAKEKERRRRDAEKASPPFGGSEAA